MNCQAQTTTTSWEKDEKIFKSGSKKEKFDQISEAKTGNSRSGSTADVAKHCIP